MSNFSVAEAVAPTVYWIEGAYRSHPILAIDCEACSRHGRAAVKFSNAPREASMQSAVDYLVLQWNTRMGCEHHVPEAMKADDLPWRVDTNIPVPPRLDEVTP